MIAYLVALAVTATPLDESGCLDARGNGMVELSGMLRLEVFPGPPNYQSVESGDLAESTYILELPESLCLEDGLFLEPGTRFDRAQLYSTDRLIAGTLSANVGRTIRVRGDGFGSITGHHHAPLVIEVGEVEVQGEAGADR